MINFVYDKTMENMRKKIRLVNNEKGFLKYTSRPTHIAHKIYDKSYADIQDIKPVLMLNKPIYVGFTVAELTKWFLYNFHYNFHNNTLMLNCYLLIWIVLLSRRLKVF